MGLSEMIRASAAKLLFFVHIANTLRNKESLTTESYMKSVQINGKGDALCEI